MINKFLKLLRTAPLVIPQLLLMKFYKLWIKSMKNVEIEGKFILKGLPLIDISKGSKLVIGSDVTLNSRNRGYHINMHSPVKLQADRPGAIIKIGRRTRIHGTCLHAYESIVIGENCLIAANCQIFDGNGHDLSFPNVSNRINTSGSSRPVTIQDDVWIGANSIILPGVTVGRGSVISANSVVVKDVPPMVVVGGNPAVLIKSFLESENPNN